MLRSGTACQSIAKSAQIISSIVPALIELKKLKFIQILKDNYDGSKGPIKQIIEKLSTIERDYVTMRHQHTTAQTDMRRAVADMTEVTRTIRIAAMTEDRQTATQAAKKLEGIEHRLIQYSWNQK